MLLAQVNDRGNRRKEVLLIIVSGDEVSEILEDTSVTWAHTGSNTLMRGLWDECKITLWIGLVKHTWTNKEKWVHVQNTDGQQRNLHGKTPPYNLKIKGKSLS